MHASTALLLFAALLGAGCSDTSRTPRVAGGEPERGKAAIERFGCAACHAIPGIASYGAGMGPPLSELVARSYIAGVLPNTPENQVRWLRNPPQVNPRSAMPALGLTEAEAADIAAYLYAAH
jgi:mono/diheme cytochrome c family protein